MIIDSSAILAIVLLEPDEAVMMSAILEAKAPRMSAANWLEAALVVDGKDNAAATMEFEALLHRFKIEIVSVTPQQAVVAREAHQRYGRRRHRAKLNYGDCFAYALAKVTGEPLLFKGDDFRQTDVPPALRD